jgi:hypothetical protein
LANKPKKKTQTDLPAQAQPTDTVSNVAIDIVPVATVTRKLWLYRVRVKLELSFRSNYEEAVENYYVTAPTQCAATKFTAIQNGVVDILFVKRLMESDVDFNTPIGAKTLYTEEDCT